MKNIFLFLSLALLVSCESSDKEISAVNELVSQWDTVSMAATDFSKMLNDANADYTQKIASISIDSMSFSKLPVEQQDKINGAETSLKAAGAQLAQLTDDLGDVLDQWTSKSEMVKALKESLTTMQFSETTLSDVGDLNQFVSDTKGKLNQFTQRLESAKSEVMQHHADLNGFLSATIQ